MIKPTGKKIEVEEKACYCDFCDNIMEEDHEKDSLEQSARIDFTFGWFSKRDGESYTYDACNNCAEDIYKMLNEKYPHLKENK